MRDWLDEGHLAWFVLDVVKAIEGCFFGVLRLCAAAGLVSVDSIAIDGTKMATDASLKANRSGQAIEAELERLRAKAKLVIAEARAADAADAAEDAQGELFASDRLPGDLSSSGGRRARLEAALELIEADQAAQRAEAARQPATAAEAAAQGRKLTGRKPTDPGQALARAEADLAAVYKKIEVAVAERAAERARLESQARLEGRRLRGPKPDGARPREKRWICQAEAARATVVDVARRHPGLKIVLDHCGPPDLRGGDDFPFAAELFSLASERNVSVGLSSHVFEAAHAAGASPVRFTARLVEAFGAERVQWASDHTIQHRGLDACLREAEEATSWLTPGERNMVLGGAAAKMWWPATATG